MILLFDTETTGLKPGNICQLSYICMENDGSVTGHNYFFAVDYIEPAASRITGLTVEGVLALSDGKTFEDRFFSFRDDFARADVVVAHNFVFDMLFMEAEYRRLGDVFRVRKRFDTMRHFTPILRLPGNHSNPYKFPKLSELLTHYGVTEIQVQSAAASLFGAEATVAHDARFDTAALYCLMSAAAHDLPTEITNLSLI